MSCIQKLASCVDESWRSPVIDEVLTLWDHDPGTARYFRSSANHVFVFKAGGRTHWLRLGDPEERNITLLQAEIEVLTYLADQPVQVVRPILSLRGNYLERVTTPIGEFCCTVFAGLLGKHYETDALTTYQFTLWGAALGKLHNALRNAPQHACLNRPSYADHLAFVQHTVPPCETVVHNELRQVQAWVGQLNITPDNFGLIHYDFEQDNLRWRENSISALDFDDCANYWFAADIAFALRDLYHDNPKCVDFYEPRLHCFLQGYKQVAQVDIQLVAELPWFVRMHNLVSYAKLVHAVDCTDNTLRSGDTSLREKLLATMTRYRAWMAEQ